MQVILYQLSRQEEVLPFFPETRVARRASQAVPVVKNPPASAGDDRDEGRSLGWADPLEEGMATHSSILAWGVLTDRAARWAYSPWGCH